MTPTQQEARDEKIHALKRAGVGMSERAELARQQLAAEAATRAEPETSDPPAVEPRVARDNDKRTEPETTERDGDERTEKVMIAATTGTPPAVTGGPSSECADLNGSAVKASDEASANITRLLNSPQAAAILGVCERTLWTLGKHGDIPRVNVGRSVRYDPVDWRAWIERQKRSR